MQFKILSGVKGPIRYYFDNIRQYFSIPSLFLVAIIIETTVNLLKTPSNY